MGLFLTNEETIYAQKAAKEEKAQEQIAQNITIEPQRSESIVYKVKSGDGLSKIAQKYHCRTTQIKEWNNLKSDRLSVGQSL